MVVTGREKTDARITKLKRERTALLAELGTMTEIIHASWLERYSTCARKDCACHRGKKHGPRYYVVIGEGGRQRQKYVPLSQVDIVRAGVDQARRAQTIMHRITLINVELMRQEVLHERS